MSESNTEQSKGDSKEATGSAADPTGNVAKDVKNQQAETKPDLTLKGAPKYVSLMASERIADAEIIKKPSTESPATDKQQEEI